MATRRELHEARRTAVAALGKELTRRARSRCELCEASSGLQVVEVPPVEEDPSVDAAILACPRCRELVEGGKLPRETDALRFLEGAAWSEVQPVQLAAVRLLRRLDAAGVSWAREALDGLWLDEELEARL